MRIYARVRSGMSASFTVPNLFVWRGRNRAHQVAPPRMPEHDLLIGKNSAGEFLRFGGSEHTVLHARSGSGKSVGFSIPNAFGWPRRSSAGALA